MQTQELITKKQEIREKIFAVRKKMSNNTILAKSRFVIENLKLLEEYKSAKTIMCYISLDSEVNTWEFIKSKLADGKEIVVPYIDVNDVLSVSKLKSFDNLVVGKYGVLEPKNKLLYDEKIDLMILPGLAFDVNGSRIGFGKGYFDKFLSKHTKSVKVALAFEEQIIDFIPTTKYDVYMDVIVTDKRLIKSVCGAKCMN